MLRPSIQFDDRAARESANRAVDWIVDWATDAALDPINEAREKIRALFEASPLELSEFGRGIHRIDEIIHALRPALNRVLEKASMGAVLTGSADALESVPSHVAQGAAQATGAANGPPDPPRLADLAPAPDDDGAVEFPLLEETEATLRESRVFVGSDYLETAREVREGAFGITAQITDEAATKVRDLLAENLREGADRRKFQADVLESLGSEAEDGPLSEAHLRNIFRTNSAQYHQRGMEKSLRAPLVEDWFPYRKQIVTHDRRVRPDHRILETTGLSGTAIYHRDDPVWLTLGGAHDFNCRCTEIPETVEGAAEEGVAEAREWLARANGLAERYGGRFEDYLAETAPDEFQRVPWPQYEGQPILPSPGFRK